MIIQGVPPQAGSAVPGFRAQGTPLLAQQPPAAPPLPNAGKLAWKGIFDLSSKVDLMKKFLFISLFYPGILKVNKQNNPLLQNQNQIMMELMDEHNN